MPPRIFTPTDGLLPVDLAHCGLDHLTSAQKLFNSGPSHYDSAGYLAHIGIELLVRSGTILVFEIIFFLSMLNTLLARMALEC